MAGNLDKNVKRLKVEIAGIDRSVGELEASKDEPSLILAWINFTRHVKLTCALLVRAGKANVGTRGLSWRIENEIKANAIIQYVIASRNHLEHVEDDGKEDFIGGEFRNADYTIPGLLSSSDGVDVQFEKCFFNGKLLDGSVSWRKGKERPDVSLTIVGQLRKRGFYPGAVTDILGSEIGLPYGVATGEDPDSVYIARYVRKEIQMYLSDLKLAV